MSIGASLAIHYHSRSTWHADYLRIADGSGTNLFVDTWAFIGTNPNGRTDNLRIARDSDTIAKRMRVDISQDTILRQARLVNDRGTRLEALGLGRGSGALACAETLNVHELRSALFSSLQTSVYESVADNS